MTEIDYEIQGDYGSGWETVHTTTDRREADETLRTYRENEPGCMHRLRVARIMI